MSTRLKKNKLQTTVLIVMLIGLAAFLPLSCGAAQKQQISVCRPGYPERDPGFWGPVLKAFGREYPNIKVEVKHMSWPEYNTKFALLVSSKGFPDVWTFGAASAAEGYDLGVVLPITDRIDEELRNDIPQSLWDYETFKGEIVGVPSDIGPLALWYHKGIFKEAGLDPNKPPTTWDEFLDYAKKITKNTEVAGFGLPGSAAGHTLFGDWSCFYYAALNQRQISPEGKPLFTSPKAIEATQFWVDLYQKHKVTPPGIENYKRHDFRTLLRDGRIIGMYHDGPQAQPVFATKHDFSSEEACGVGVALTPKAPGQAESHTHVYGATWVISSYTKHPDAAWKLLRFIVRPEWDLLANRIYGTTPIHKSQMEMLRKEDWWLKTFMKAASGSFSFQAETLKTTGYWKTMVAGLQRILLGKISVQEGLEKLAREVEELTGYSE